MSYYFGYPQSGWLLKSIDQLLTGALEEDPVSNPDRHGRTSLDTLSSQ
jgi:hypothetical protein